MVLRAFASGTRDPTASSDAVSRTAVGADQN